MAKFQVHKLIDKDAGIWEPMWDDYGNRPFQWNNAVDAARDAKYYTETTGILHQIRPVKEVNVDWHKRELERFESGNYTKLPWHDEPWLKECKACVHHFAHVAKANTSNIAFTPNDQKGQFDVKTSMRATKYITNYYSKVLGEEKIRELIAQYKKLYCKESGLKFAYTADEIQRVYEKGPRSCMTDKSFKVHPVRAYEGPDLAVAYVNSKNGRSVAARALCWPKKRIYGRLYGDQHLLRELLEDEGFTQGGGEHFQKARLTKIKVGNQYVCPYIDWVTHVKIGKKYIWIDNNGKHPCRNQNGFCGAGFNCHQCGEIYPLHKVEQHNVNGYQWCANCFHTHLRRGDIFRCAWQARTHRAPYCYYWMQDGVVMSNGEIWHHYHANQYGFRCRECGQLQDRAHLRAGNQVWDINRDRYGQRALIGTCTACPVQHELPLR